MFPVPAQPDGDWVLPSYSPSVSREILSLTALGVTFATAAIIIAS
jgi:hypothetical protein